MNKNMEEKDKTEKDKELLQPMIDAFIASARHTLEYNVIKYSMKRYESFFCIKSYYRKKLYKAILDLREFNKQNPK
ncbi:hypothetical protein [Dysgonomonas capnocytophagoides]|uniref:hypothetical protein n=2 Tax=Dysgonomonas capnocytophagoides TaxID=45254 RepID=UPI00333F75B7